MGNLGVFEADANAGKLSAEAAENSGFELEKSIDRAIFRAKEKFGAYLANAQSKSEFDERWNQIKPDLIKVIAGADVKPVPGVLRRVGAALRPSLPAQQQTKKVRPSSAKTATAGADTSLGTKVIAQGGQAGEQPWMPLSQGLQHQASIAKLGWSYDQSTKLYTSNDPMVKFACPGCGGEHDLGFSHCAGCNRTWNSWPVRQAGSGKTASTYVVMAREIKMRGDQFKLATAKPEEPVLEKTAEVAKEADMQQPGFGTMPGDNSGAVGAPLPPEPPAAPAPPAPAPGDRDGDGDVAGGVTEDSPIDQIQDALQDAVMALKDVQMLSINPALTMTASDRNTKVATLREKMDHFWGLHKQLNYVAGMLAKEANEAVRAADPRIKVEAEFVQGFEAAKKNEPLPEKTGRAWLEGYVAFHKQAESYSDDANIGQLFEPTGQDESTAGNEGSTFPDTESTNEIRGDAGPFDTSQPASQAFVSQMDADNAKGDADRGQGQSGSIQPTGAKKAAPKAGK